MIANNRGGIAKRLWSELGQGEQIQLRVLEDEHAEARFVVGEIERLIDEGASRSEIAVLYRTNAMSRVIEDALVRRGVAYQVIGGTKFYERAEIKDAIAYLCCSPTRTMWSASPASPTPRDAASGDLARPRGRARRALGVSVWEVAAHARAGPGPRHRGRQGARPLHGTMAELRSMAGMARSGRRPKRRGATDSDGEGAEQGVPVADLLEAVLSQTGYIEALEAERTIESQGRIENLEQLVEVAREFDARRPARGAGHARRVPAAGRPRRRRATRAATTRAS